MRPAYRHRGNKGFAGNEPIDKPQIDQFAGEMDDFSTVLKEDGTSLVSGEEGLRDLLVIDAIYNAVKSGKAVDVANSQR